MIYAKRKNQKKREVRVREGKGEKRKEELLILQWNNTPITKRANDNFKCF